MTPRGSEGGPQVGVVEELRRRRVPRVTIAYLASAYAVLEIIAFVELPQGAFRAALGTLVLGFPVAVVLAWAFDLTESGVVRTPEDAADDPSYQAGPGRGWVAVTVISLVVGAVLRFLR